MRRITVNNELFLDEVARIIAQGSSATIRVKGTSMLPFLKNDTDKVVLEAADTIAKHDIVLAKIGNRYILHRVIAIENQKLTLMGDGNVVGREHCNRQDVVGKVIRRIQGDKEVKMSKRFVPLWLYLLPIRKYLLFIYKRIQKLTS